MKSNMYESTQLKDTVSLADPKTEHLRSLSAPLDAYWEEALIGFADHYEMKVDGDRAGFYATNAEQQLVAFYLTQKYASHGEKGMAYVISKHKIKEALVGTNDSYFLSLCLGVAKNQRVHTLLFEDNEKLMPDAKGSLSMTFEMAGEEDFEDVVRHYVAASGAIDTESVEAGFEGLKGYVRSLMDTHHIFVLREDGKVVATSECRISNTQKPFADVGMIVAAEHRRKGVGSHILARTKAFCYEKGAIPICSCEAENIGSKKAIANAGFVSRNCVVLFMLDE